MNNCANRCHAYSIGEGPRVPANGVSALGFNIANQRVALEKIGTTTWWDTMLHEVRLMGQPELLNIVGTVDEPRNPRKFKLGRSITKRPKKPEPTDIDWIKEPVGRKKREQKFSKRVEMGIAELEQCDPEFTSFITAILSVCTDYSLVQQHIRSAMESFRQFLFRRFPDHKALLFVEFDAKLA